MDEKINKSKYFLAGVTVMIVSSVYGYVALFGFPLLALRYGKVFTKIGIILYFVSWITFGIGILMAGKPGIVYMRNFWKRIFKRKNEES